MRKFLLSHKILALAALVLLGWTPAHAGPAVATDKAPARMTVTLQLQGENKRMPEVTSDDVVVKQGKDRLSVKSWAPANGERAGLDLFVLIDDSSDSRLGSQLSDLRDFINAQPSTTAVGVGYMRNGTIDIAQNFTTEHEQAAKSVRLPLAQSGSHGSPFLSVIDLMKRWPDNGNRREVLMITDGIDRFRGGPRYRSLNINPDVYSASNVAQKTGTIIHTMFARGAGHLGSNFWEVTNGQNAMALLSDQTGGQSYFLGTGDLVSFKPYLDNLQKVLDNQYLVEFQVNASKKAGLQPVTFSTEVAGVELGSANNTWVEAR
jgi:hypothetical protein